MAFKVYLLYPRQTRSLLILKLVTHFSLLGNHCRFWGLGFGHVFLGRGDLSANYMVQYI